MSKYFIELDLGGVSDCGEVNDTFWTGSFKTLAKAENHFTRYRFDWQDTIDKFGMVICKKKHALSRKREIVKVIAYACEDVRNAVKLAGFNKKKKEFLEHYLVVGTIKEASELANIGKGVHAYWIKHDKDFEKKFIELKKRLDK